MKEQTNPIPQYSASSNNSVDDDYDPLHEEFSESSLPDSQPQNTSDILHSVVPRAVYSPSFINSPLSTDEDIKLHKTTIKQENDTIDDLDSGSGQGNIILQEMVEVTPRREDSPTHNFFSSMADIVCKFPPEKIAEARMRVCTLVSEMEVQVLKDGSHTSLRR